MDGRRVRAWLAVGGSLLLHAGLLGGLAWTVTQREAPPAPASVLEARLVAVAPPRAAPALPPPMAPRPSRVAVPTPQPRPAPSPPAAAAVSALPAAQVDAPSVEAASAIEDAAPDPAAAMAQEDVAPLPDGAEPGLEAVATPVPEAAPAPLNPLPPRVAIRFQVRYGLAAGEQSLLWVNEGGRYTVSSVAEATGIAGVLYRGRFVQTSRGRITPDGLQPEEFWDQRGDKRSTARFGAGQVTLMPAKGAPRHFDHEGGVQDALSLFFQLALTAPPPQGELAYTVFNGKKLRIYRYETRGEVVLETALGPLRTLHLARVADADGRFEVWLAIDRHYLPVRVLRSDGDGNAMELRVQSLSP